jgi:hypothetical protein
MAKSARERLLAQEMYNDRSFPLITEELVAAVEVAAVATERARLRALVEGLDSAVLTIEGTGQIGYPSLVNRAAVLALLDEQR